MHTQRRVPRREVDGIFIRAAINRRSLRQEGSVDRVGRDLKYRAKKIDERSRRRCLHARLSLHASEYRERAKGRSINRWGKENAIRPHSIGMDSTFAANQANPRQERFQDRGMTRENRIPRAFPRKRGQPFREPRD